MQCACSSRSAAVNPKPECLGQRLGLWAGRWDVAEKERRRNQEAVQRGGWEGGS